MGASCINTKPGRHGRRKREESKSSFRVFFSQRRDYAKMWMMDCGRDTASLNTNSSSFHAAPTKLRPLIPHPLHRFLRHHQRQQDHSSSSSPSSTTTSDFIPLNLASSAGQSRRGVNGLTAAVSSRWNPTPEQLRTLEDLYRRGTRTPTAEQIQYITAHLRRYGKIEGKNVFYWFQNHKARERQKRRRQAEAAMEAAARFRPEIDFSPDKEYSYAVWGAGLEKAKNWMPSFRPADETGLSGRLGRWDEELHPGSPGSSGRVLASSLESRRLQLSGSAVVLQRAPQYSASSSEDIAGLLFHDPRNPAPVLRRGGGGGLSDKEHAEAEADGGTEAETLALELFPLRSDSAHDEAAAGGLTVLDAAVVVVPEDQQTDFHGQQFFQFLPLKN